MKTIKLDRDPAELRALMHEALLSSYRFWVGRMDGGERKASDRSFNEVLESCLGGMAQWSCVEHQRILEGDIEHWEFHAISFLAMNDHIHVLVRSSRALEILEQFNININ